MVGPDYPTILFHHGNNEDPFDTGMFAKHSFKMIFEPNRESTDANIIAIRAPFHGGSLKEYTSRISHLSNFVSLLAVSVVLIDQLIAELKKSSNQTVLVSGISLGGWVTNLHRTYFNSADLYVQLLVGAALAEVFLTSKYQKMTGALAQVNPEVIRENLNFEDDFAQVKTNNVLPLLGRHDQFIRFERQKQCYQQHPSMEVLDKGHVTSLLASKKLFAHLMKSLRP